MSGSYTLLSKNGAWYLSGATGINYLTNWNTYKNEYKVGLDDTGFYTQTGIVLNTSCVLLTQTGCLTLFTRELSLNIV